MTERTRQVVNWLPRILGIAVGLFVALFAFDAFDRNAATGELVQDFAIHLVPSAVLLVAVAVAWRHPLIGAATFVGLGVFYAIAAQRLDWIVVISGPLVMVGMLFAWSGGRQAAANRRPRP